MKWSVTVQQNEETEKVISEAAKGPIKGPFGIILGRICRLQGAINQDGTECYFVEIEGSPLYYLDQLISLRYVHKSNNVLPYWISERGIAEYK